MENRMQIFQNEEFGELRTVRKNGDPWFVGKDVAKALGYSNPRKAIIDHVDPEDRYCGDGVFLYSVTLFWTTKCAST